MLPVLATARKNQNAQASSHSVSILLPQLGPPHFSFLRAFSPTIASIRKRSRIVSTSTELGFRSHVSRGRNRSCSGIRQAEHVAESGSHYPDLANPPRPLIVCGLAPNLPGHVRESYTSALAQVALITLPRPRRIDPILLFEPPLRPALTNFP